jgi:hypothetical protein
MVAVWERAVSMLIVIDVFSEVKLVMYPFGHWCIDLAFEKEICQDEQYLGFERKV